MIENTYGIAKRLDVVSAWTADVVRWLGKSRLDILDYGCGTGDHLAAPLAALGHSVVGVDMHAESIADASRRFERPGLTFRTGDLDILLKEGRTYDLVLCSEVIEHVDDPDGFLSGLAKLSRPDGAVIITTPNGYGSFELLCAIRGVAMRLGLHQCLRRAVLVGRKALARMRGLHEPDRPLEGVTSDADRGFLNMASTHVQFYTVGRLERLFQGAGLQIIARRARTLLCGPYVDAVFALSPWREAMFRLNNRSADLLPFRIAADWMFLLRRTQ